MTERKKQFQKWFKSLTDSFIKKEDGKIFFIIDGKEKKLTKVDIDTLYREHNKNVDITFNSIHSYINEWCETNPMKTTTNSG